MSEDSGNASGQWFAKEEVGYASPVSLDLDGDGLRDLIVGGFSGRFRFYRNTGSTEVPEYAGFEWVRSSGEIATLFGYCCMAATPRFADLDGDMIHDLVAGSYAPGVIYWFKGAGDGSFGSRHQLTDWTGLPVISRMDKLGKQPFQAYGTKPAVADWNDDKRPDLILGTKDGHLFVRINKGLAWQDGVTPIPLQPVFAAFSDPFGHKGNSDQPSIAEFEILVGEEAPLVDESQLVPEIADWDGDGLWDIIVGVESGAVYWLKNVGASDRPEFMKPEILLSSGVSHQWRDDVGFPVRGRRAEVHAVDYDNDGDIDLLVGDNAVSIALDPSLDASERRLAMKLRNDLQELDSRVGYSESFSRNRDDWDGYVENPLLQELAKNIETQLKAYLEVVDSARPAEAGWFRYQKNHGRVWVYLREDGASF